MGSVSASMHVGCSKCTEMYVSLPYNDTIDIKMIVTSEYFHLLILLKPQLLLHFLKCNPRPIYSCKWLFVAGIHMLLSFTRPTDPQPNALYDASFSNTFYFFCTLAYTFCFSLSSAQRELQWSLERQVHAQNE